MKPILISIAMISMVAFISRDRLIGRWESKPSPKGNVTSVFFKSDSSFEGFVNKKPFVTGTYTLRDDIFSFVDNGCNGKRGIYKLIFYSNGDSIRFDPITDSCAERKDGMSKLILGRIK